MKANRALLISILLNLALLGWIIAMSVTRRHELNSSASANTSEASKEAPQFRPQLIVVTNQGTPFDWSQVESPDYRQYIANLRAIGCPELTIREIVKADVNDLFSARRSALTKTNKYQYWRAGPMNLSKEQAQQLDELSIEQCELLKALGIEPTSADLTAFRYGGNYANQRAKELEFLPDDKRKSLEDLLFQQAQRSLAAGNDQGRLAELREQSQSEIRSLLTPDEWYEYGLRTSMPAAGLRSALKELQPTEQEFRTIFDYWIALKQHEWGTPGYREAQRSSESGLRSLLGSDRFSLYLEGLKRVGY
jgi:hypothetical protein